MSKRTAIALAVSLVACGGVPFETVPLVVGPDAGDDAPSASSSSSSGGSSMGPPDAAGDVADPQDTSAPPTPDAAPELEAETSTPPVDAGADACAVMHSNGVAACTSETFVDCTSGISGATANDACKACNGGAFPCPDPISCPDPTGTGASGVLCGPIGPSLSAALWGCWGYSGRLAGYVRVSANETCPTTGDPRWY